MSRSVSDPGQPQLLQVNKTYKDNLHASLTTIKEDCHEWQSDAVSMRSLTSSGYQRQVLSGPAKSMSGKPSPFSSVKHLQLPQSASGSKQGNFILINRLSSEGSSVKNESESQTTNALGPYLESAHHPNSSDPRRLNMQRQNSNCSPFAVQIISDGLEDTMHSNAPNSHRDRHRSSDLQAGQENEASRWQTVSNGTPEVIQEDDSGELVD